MNLQKAPALVLAALLQVVPLARVACVNQAVAPTGFAVVLRWLAGAVALLGSYHAVSGASAAVAGVIPINPTTQQQTGPVTLTAAGTNGQTFAYRIYVTNPGNNPQQAYYNAIGLPPGLTVNTNLGANGDILGTPTAPGVYFPVTLIAGNANYVGTVQTNITITIAAAGGSSPPSITGPPKSQTVTVGTNVSFTVTATGTAPLHYFWSFNGTNIATATTSSLQVTNVQLTDSGTYKVIVSNSVSTASASATLTVNAAGVAPSITTQPVDLVVSNGASASFSVTANGTAPLSYQWFKGTSALLAGTSSSYTINPASTNDSGTYSVIITNAAGSITSSVANLSVLLPPTISTAPQAITTNAGATATFTVVASGSPTLAYFWQFSGGPLTSANSSSFTIPNVQSGNQGDYSVIVSNAVGLVTSPLAHLTVQTSTGGPLQVANWQVANGTVSFDVTGPSQTNVVVWTSTDLAHWSAVSTNFSSSGTVHFSETSGPGPVEFYRATLSP